MSNAKLAYEVLDYIEAHPSEWKQEVWTCGSSACFAGWSTVLGNPGKQVKFTTRLGRIFGGDSARESITIGGFRENVKRTAMRLLDIDSWEATKLFDADNTFSDLQDHVRKIFGPRPAEEFPSVVDDIGNRDVVVSMLFDQVAEHQTAIVEINDKIAQLNADRTNR